MTPIVHPWLVVLGLALAAIATIYSVLANWAVRPRGFIPAAAPSQRPPVTVLKPLCGAETETYECLRSVCDQDYPDFQVLFGVSDDQDPSIAIARRLQREFPSRHVQLVIDRQQHGGNRKVSNLINMMPFARHAVLVMSDSDVRVTRDYLSRVTGPLADHTVGVVTCAYQGRARAGVWSLLGSLFINEWFLPSVCVASRSGSSAFAFGATIAMRREVLSNIGGFNAIADQLADDYRLGELTRGLGLRTVLSDLIVETCVTEQSFMALVRHELRWLRTIRALRPYSYALCFITFGMPVSALGALLTGGARSALVMLAMTVAARIRLHFRVAPDGARTLQLLALPVRDVLNLGLWLWSYTNRRVQWRDDYFQVGRDGSVQVVASEGMKA